jgi:His/Glu/Gln/Arg/opine family amino acid ABC transporter permease subunit
MSPADYLALLQGAGVTVALSIAGILLGVPAGLGLALIRWADIPVLAPAVAVYVSVLRATPLVTLTLLIFFALPTLGLDVKPIPAAILALTMNTAAFNCEVWRAALVDFPRDQLEAARAFGMSPRLIVRRIMLGQVWRTSLPGLVNEMTLLIKGSPAIAVVGVVEITRAAVRIGAETYEPLPPFLAATGIYVVIVLVFIRIQCAVETRINAEPGLT